MTLYDENGAPAELRVQKQQPMKGRLVRVDDDLWQDAQRVAAQRDENVSEVVRAALRRYVKRHS